jgi:hypothetical protein
MFIFSLFLQVGILWFLITLYSNSTNSSTSLRETWIVVLGVATIGIVARFLLGGILGPFVGIINLIALYVLVDKVCGLPQRNTIKICAWYVLVSILVNIVSSILATPVTAAG